MSRRCFLYVSFAALLLLLFLIAVFFHPPLRSQLGRILAPSFHVLPQLQLSIGLAIPSDRCLPVGKRKVTSLGTALADNEKAIGLAWCENRDGTREKKEREEEEKVIKKGVERWRL